MSELIERYVHQVGRYLPSKEPVSYTHLELTADQLKIFGTLPEEATPTDFEMSDELIDLGRMLYFEQRMSASGNMSCNTCHGLNLSLIHI